MTKFYLLAAATLIAGGANAALNINVVSEELQNSASMAVEAATMINNGAVTPEQIATRMKVRKLDDNQSDSEWKALGMGTMTDAWILYSFSSDFYATLYVEIEESTKTPGLYRMVDLYGYDNIYGNGYGFFSKYNDNLERTDIIIDATDPEYVVVEPQYSGWTFPEGVCKDNDGNPVTDLFISSGNFYYEKEEGLTREQVKQQYPSVVSTMADGVITIPVASYGSSLENAHLGNNVDELGKPVPVVITLPTDKGGYEPDENWVDAGMCQFINGYYGRDISADLIDNSYEVPVEASVLEPGVFRFQKPFFQPNSTLLQSYPTHRFDDIYDYFVVDCRVPDFVFVEPYNSQMYFFDDELMYATNIYYHYTIKLGMTRKEVVDYLRANPDIIHQGNMYAEFKNGVITIAQSIFIVDSMPNAYLPVPGNRSTVIDLRGTTAIDLPAIDNSDAPVEYFNLQGQPVATPADGQLVIKRQGSDVSKILYNR